MELTLSMIEKTETGIVTTLLGMITVFVVLIILIFFVTLLKNLSGKKDEKVVAEVSPSPVVEIVQEEVQEDDLQLVAVISAALNAYLSDQGGSLVRVHSIRRITSPDNSWSVTGRNETIIARQNLYK